MGRGKDDDDDDDELSDRLARDASGQFCILGGATGTD